jgi:hypothetical protein
MSWTCAVDNYFIFATYNFEPKYSSLVKDEIVKAKKALVTFKLIAPEFRNAVRNRERFRIFMASIASVIDLKNKAVENGSFIEFVALTANHIDALLRLSIVLTSQIENNTSELDVNLFHQQPTDAPLLERKIYEIALSKKIITEPLFQKLTMLYRERNKVIHQFIITDIKSIDVMKIADEYQLLQESISELTNLIERKQFDSKIGIHATELPPGTHLNPQKVERIINQVKDKHGISKWKPSLRWNKEKSI